MERLRCIRLSQERIPFEMSLSATPPSGFLKRPLMDWLGLRRRSHICGDDGFLLKRTLFAVDVDYQYSTGVDPDAEHCLILEPGPDRWDFDDPDPANVFWDHDLEASETIHQGLVKNNVSPNLDFVVEGNKSLSEITKDDSFLGLSRKRFKYIAVSWAVHVTALSLAAEGVGGPSLSGQGGLLDRPVYVRLMETPTVNTREIPTPSSIDSPSSAPSQARRDKMTENEQVQQKVENQPDDKPNEAKIDQRFAEAKPDAKPFHVHDKVIPQKSLKDNHPVDSKSLSDSVASMPSEAALHRKGSLKAGDQAQTYRDLVIAAIHDAVYYPKAALGRMAHG